MNDVTSCRIAVIGGGIAGVSVAVALASQGSVMILEGEAQPGYHATGRSAATFAANYGNATIRALTRASRKFFWNPPEGFGDAPLYRSRPELHVARPEQYPVLDKLLDQFAPVLVEASADRMHELCPVLRPEIAWRAAVASNSADLEVHAILQSYLRQARASGVRFMPNAGVTAITRRGSGWELRTTSGRVRADIIVNAAGAWADSIARMAGVRELQLIPHRRTVALVDAPPGYDPTDWAFVMDVEEHFYFKPDAGRVLVSHADETPVDASDVQPDDLDVACAIEKLEAATVIDVRKAPKTWAGLRTFARDRAPVIGFDPRADGFFWFAAQGGYGIQIAPAAAAAAGALFAGRPLSPELIDAGVRAADLTPERLIAA